MRHGSPAKRSLPGDRDGARQGFFRCIGGDPRDRSHCRDRDRARRPSRRFLQCGGGAGILQPCSGARPGRCGASAASCRRRSASAPSRRQFKIKCSSFLTPPASAIVYANRWGGAKKASKDFVHSWATGRRQARRVGAGRPRGRMSGLPRASGDGRGREAAADPTAHPILLARLGKPRRLHRPC